MYVRLLFLGGFISAALGFMGFCTWSLVDSFVSYTVVNNTDQELLTWHMSVDCSELIGHRYDYALEERVPPGKRIVYGDAISGASKKGCIQVATTDRRLVFVQRYTLDAVVVISEPLAPISDPVPPIEELPAGDWDVKAFIEETPPLLLGTSVLFGIGTFGMLAAGLVAIGRPLYRSVLRLTRPRT